MRASACACRPAELTTASAVMLPGSCPPKRISQPAAFGVNCSTGVSNAITPPLFSRSPCKASMKACPSMMPVSGDTSAAMQDNSGSSARAALPPISSRPSTPLLRPCASMRLDPRAFGVVGRDDQLAAFAVRDAAARAEFVQHPVAVDAMLRAQRADRIIHPGMDDFAVAGRHAGADAGRGFGDDHIVSRHRRLARDGKTDGARAYDQNLQADVSLPKFHAAVSRRTKPQMPREVNESAQRNALCAIFRAPGARVLKPNGEQSPII